MVEILRRGTRPDETTHMHTCSKCYTLFRFSESEADFMRDQRDGDAWKIECPVCQRVCWVAA